MRPTPDIAAIAATLLHDNFAEVRVRTLAAAVHHRRRLIGRGPSPIEAWRLREAYDRQRRAVVDLTRAYGI